MAKNIFNKSNGIIKRINEKDDYTVKSNKRIDWIVRIISILAALVIWCAVVNIDTKESKLNDLTIRSVNYSTTVFTGYTQSWSDSSIDIKVKGKSGVIDLFTESSVIVEADFSVVKNEDIYNGSKIEIPIKITIPDNIVLLDQSAETIVITLTSLHQDGK